MAPERDIFANFERMRREMDELFGDVLGRSRLASPRRAAFTPLADVYYTGEPPRAIVHVDLSGVRIDEVSLEIQGRELVVCGQRRPVAEVAGAGEAPVYQQIEIPHGSFRRVLELGAEVVAEEAKAVYRDGILRVELPIAQRKRQPRTVVPVQTIVPED
jgi:HSP20 family protein